jgi:hypothetical protein
MMSGAKVNLLIVDGEPSARTTFSEIFTQFGYSVRSAGDGSTALVEIRQGLPDILLADLNMPGISGFELLSMVRDRFPTIQVIATSGDFSGIFIPPGVCRRVLRERQSTGLFVANRGSHERRGAAILSPASQHVGACLDSEQRISPREAGKKALLRCAI